MNRLLLDESKQHDDLRLIHRAMKQRWEIPNATRKLVMERITSIIEHGADDIALKAIGEIRQMEAQNQKDEHKVVDIGLQLKDDDVVAIAAELGIDAGVIIDAARLADGDIESVEAETETEGNE